ncbi:MAG: hypothetical protein IJM15_08955, partial [Erysipelotrichaceae bacterium]|nr:hypothetical protein [Erysipelotrichaceae bacterium]
MKRIMALFLAVFMVSILFGCNSKIGFGKHYNDELIVSSKITYYSVQQQSRITRDLSNEELDEYLKLFAQASESADFRNESVIGWMQPDVVISIETENIYYHHYYQPFRGFFSESNERMCYFPVDSDLIKAVRRLSEGAGEKQTLSENSFSPIELFSDTEDRTVYMIKGSEPAAMILSKLGTEINDQNMTFADYFRSHIAGREIAINDEITAGNIRYLCINTDPCFFEGILDQPILDRNFITIKKADCYASQDDCFVEIETGAFRCDGDMEFEIEAVASDERWNEIAMFTERKSVEENQTVRFSSKDIADYSGYEKSEYCAIGLKIYCDGVLRFKGMPESFQFIETIDGSQQQYSESIRYAYNLQNRLYDQQGRWFFKGNRSNDFMVGFMEMIRHDDGIYEFVIGVEPFYRIEYHIESIGLYHMDGTPYVSKDSTPEVIDLGYNWTNDADYQNLVYVVSADRGPDGLQVVIKYNDGKTAGLPLDYAFNDTRAKKYTGRDDIEAIREEGYYHNLFTLDQYDNVLYYRDDVMPSAYGIRTMGNERAREILSDKSREQIEEVLGAPKGGERGYEIYQGADTLDEIWISYKNGKVKDADYI